MPRRRIQAVIRSHGIYSAWSGRHQDLPRIRQFTTLIPAQVGIEFGYIVQIEGARGERLDFVIEHPPWRDERGRVERPFTGHFPIRTNDFSFFLGDTIWEPWTERCGPWTFRTACRNQVLATLTLTVVPPERSKAT